MVQRGGTGQGGHVRWAPQNPYGAAELWDQSAALPWEDARQGPFAPGLRVGSLKCGSLSSPICLTPGLPEPPIPTPPLPRSAQPGPAQPTGLLSSTQHGAWLMKRYQKISV